jgi:hypothetical protein
VVSEEFATKGGEIGMMVEEDLASGDSVRQIVNHENGNVGWDEENDWCRVM